MSTRKLVGGSQAKAGAKRRKKAIRELERMVNMYQPGTQQRFRAESRLESLRETQRASHMTDAEKDASFFRILNRGV